MPNFDHRTGWTSARSFATAAADTASTDANILTLSASTGVALPKEVNRVEVGYGRIATAGTPTNIYITAYSVQGSRVVQLGRTELVAATSGTTIYSVPANSRLVLALSFNGGASPTLTTEAYYRVLD